MAGMANAVNNVNVNEHSQATSSVHNSTVSGGGGLGIDLGIISLGGSVSGSSYDSKSASAFARSLSSHAESSSRHVEVATRAASSTSVGEVSTRAHSEGQSEDQFESASRLFTNPNHCHALTFLFYKLNKCQTIRWELVGIERTVRDPAAPTRQAARDAVDKELVAEGLITKNGEVSDRAKGLFGFEREIALPTAGIIVKGCLDECDICEPELGRAIELDLEHKRLENELLKKQIDLLEKSQEYRCCPDDDEGGTVDA